VKLKKLRKIKIQMSHKAMEILNIQIFLIENRVLYKIIDWLKFSKIVLMNKNTGIDFKYYNLHR